MPRSSRLLLILTLLTSLALRSVLAQEVPPPGPDDGSAADTTRVTFDTEICKVDGLKPAQCNCVWNFLSRKLSAADLRLALLLIASNSDDKAVAKKADELLDKSNASDKRRDSLSSEAAALVIEGEDACAK